MPQAADLFNECGGKELASLSELDLSTVPLMDAGGTEEFTAYIFADVFDTPGADADFIWSSNLVLDNLVLLRKTIK